MAVARPPGETGSVLSDTRHSGKTLRSGAAGSSRIKHSRALNQMGAAPGQKQSEERS